MKSMLLVALLLVSIMATNAFHLPYGLLSQTDEYPGPSKRAAYYASKPYKRQFNADDMMLRFGKRGVGEPVAFSPDMLSLRFGK